MMQKIFLFIFIGTEYSGIAIFQFSILFTVSQIIFVI